MTSGGGFSSNDLFSVVFSDDVDLMEGFSYGRPSIYKYYNFPDPVVLRQFLAHPTLKFTHKDDLNDPFELSRRWAKFGCPFKEGIVEKYVLPRLHRKLLDVRNVRKRILEDPRTKSLGLSRQRRRQIVATRIGRAQIGAHVESQFESQVENLKSIERHLPIVFQGHESEFVENFAKSTGILSLTEDEDNSCMWREYAGDGRGFVLELDSTNAFFVHRESRRKVRSLLRKVHYRDDQVEDFWKNPYYLFLVKETKWSFEKEWRVLKPLDQCQAKIIKDGKRVHFLEAPVGLIKKIIFGYKWDSESVLELGALIQRFDQRIKVSVAPSPKEQV